MGILLALMLMLYVAGCQNLDMSLKEVVTEDSIVVAAGADSLEKSDRIFSCLDESLPDATCGSVIPVKTIPSVLGEDLELGTETVKAEALEASVTVKEPEKPAVSMSEDPAVSDVPVTDERILEETGEADDTVAENNPPVLCHGFILDASGMIIGCDSVSVVDDVLCLPSDVACTGVAAGALASLGSQVFEIYIPANITQIEPGAFEGLTELFYIEVHPDNPIYGSDCGVLYEK